MDIHKVLERQLTRLNLQSDHRPENDALWQKFVSCVSQTYTDADQERYLLDRAMKISSCEMMSLNEKLEAAQHIAKLGYWTYDGLNNTTIWSKEIDVLLQLNPNEKPLSFEIFLSLIHEQDRYEFQQKFEIALSEQIDFEYEMRMRHSDRTYHWFRTICQCQEKEKQLAGIIIDIHKNKIADEKIKDLNQKIILTARRAGMAEIATTILHNIGNILNSSNVSIHLLQSSLQEDFIKKLFKVLQKLESQENLNDYLTNDVKGKLIPQYLSALTKKLVEEHDKNIIEVENLIKDLRHIGDIVAMQKSVSGLSSMNEKVYLPEVIDLAINMAINDSYSESIHLIKEFESITLIELDKSKLLQILVNLFQNAREALMNQAQAYKEIRVVIQHSPPQSVQIIVIDNGVGIPLSNVHRIFSFGFTTKKNGHGFGLHSSALSAESMGGSLFAESLGEGTGSKFILTLPLKKRTDDE